MLSSHEARACDVQRLRVCRAVPVPTTRHTSGSPTGRGRRNEQDETPQTLFFRAATGKAFTIVFAGLAFTTTTLPNISLLPAFVAGFRRVLIMQTPGTIPFPVFFTSLLARDARLSSTLEHWDFFSSVEAAIASQRAPLVRALAPAFIAFIAFPC